MRKANYRTLLNKINFCISDLTMFETYLRLSEKQLIELLEKYNQSFESFRNSEQRNLFDNRRDLFAFLSGDIPNIQRSTQIIYLMSFLEHNMNMICNWLSKNLETKISHNELKGSSLNRSYKFLIKIVDIDLNEAQEFWNNIISIQRIRNIIVHRNRIISDLSTEKDITYINSNPEFFRTYKAGKYKELLIEPKFIDFVLENVKGFLEKMYNKISESNIEEETN